MNAEISETILVRARVLGPGKQILGLPAHHKIVSPGCRGTLLKQLAPRRKPKKLHVKSQIASSYSFRDLSVHTDMDRSTRLMILMYMYTLWGRKRFCYTLSDEYSIPLYSQSQINLVNGP